MKLKKNIGELRWYDNGVPEDIFEEYMQLIDHYTKLSRQTCVYCGEIAEIQNNNGWWEPMCENCFAELIQIKHQPKGGEKQ